MNNKNQMIGSADAPCYGASHPGEICPCKECARWRDHVATSRLGTPSHENTPQAGAVATVKSYDPLKFTAVVEWKPAVNGVPPAGFTVGSKLYLATPAAKTAAPAEPFGIYVERNDGTTEFQRTGKAFSPTAQGYKFWTLYAEPFATPAAQTTATNTLATDLQEYLYRVSSQVPFEHAQWAAERGGALLAQVKALISTPLAPAPADPSTLLTPDQRAAIAAAVRKAFPTAMESDDFVAQLIWNTEQACLAARARERGQEKTEWRCFHCDAVFTDRESAAIHFGTSERHSPICSVDHAEYRAMEKRMEAYNAEDAEIHRQMFAQRNKHSHELLREEERGYARGLRDATPTTHTEVLKFADDVISNAFDGHDLDGGTIQEMAEARGLIAKRAMTEPCGDVCPCMEAGAEFPTECYRKTYSAALASPADAAQGEAE